MNPSHHSVAVLIISPQGIPLVRDPKKPTPRYWKLPGGRSEGEETPEETAVREIWEELGLKIDQDDLRVIDEQDKVTHTLTFFQIELPELVGLKEIGGEEEEIQLFSSLLDIGKMENFFPNHKSIVQKVYVQKQLEEGNISPLG